MNLVYLLRALVSYGLPLVVGFGWVEGLGMWRHLSIRERVAGEVAKVLGKKSRELPVGVRRLPGYYAVGIVYLLVGAMVARYGLQRLTGLGFEYGLLGLVGLGVVLGIGVAGVKVWRGRRLWRELRPWHWWHGGVAVVLVVAMAIAVTWVWRYRSPYPLNWDWYQHQELSRLIQQGNFEFQTSKMSDTFQFDSYPPTFHLLHALGQWGDGLDPMGLIEYWQALSFVHLVSVGLVSWLLGYVVGKSRIAGLLGGVIGTLVFDSAYSFTNIFLLPQTVAAVVFTLGMAVVVNAANQKKSMAWWQIVSLCVVLPLLHYTVGTLGAVVLGTVAVYYKLKKSWRELVGKLPVMPLIVLVTIGVKLVAKYVDLDDLNNGEAGLYRFSFSEKIAFVESSYGYSLYLLLPLGLLYVLRRERSEGENLALLLLFGFGAIVLADFPYVVKFYTITRFWVHLFMVLGVMSLLKYVPWRIGKIIGAGVVSIGFGVLLLLNVINWKTGLLLDGCYSHINQDDVAGATFLKQEYGGRDALLVSDPATQFVLEGMSGVDSVAGAYMLEQERVNLTGVLESVAAEELQAKMQLIRDGLDKSNPQVRLLAISGRTFVWNEADGEDKYSYKFNVWTPRQLAYQDIRWVRSLEKAGRFEVVFDSPSLMIAKVY